MKRGCFITTVVLFTVIVAAVVYVVKYKKDFIKEFSKNKVMDIAMNEFDKKLTEVKASVYKDSLQSKLHEFFKQNEHIPFDSAMERVQGVLSEAQFIVRDKKIDSLDFNNFKNYLTRYERSEKNRN
jgi:acetyl-CoA carboxylase beta subunit